MAKNPFHTGGRGITLDVTQEIINAAIPRDSSHCVIADALKAAVPDAQRVSVDLATIRFTDKASQKRYVYLTPAPAQALLVNFDQGKRTGPFTLKLGKPAQIVPPRTPHPVEADTSAEAKRKRDARRKRVAITDGNTVTVHGGRTPPLAALSSTRGRRRTFGLRTLKP